MTKRRYVERENRSTQNEALRNTTTKIRDMRPKIPVRQMNRNHKLASMFVVLSVFVF